MSARPDPARLSDEELDLLLSRSLDGDLSPEEESRLAEVLASDPRAARRREELAALVGKLNALPDPAPPLGLTARTNAWTAERGRGMGAFWHRLGLFPPPAMVRGIGALFVIVLIGMSVLKTQSVRQKAAESSEAKGDGRVAIFFGERGPAAPQAPAPAAPATPAREAAAAPPRENAPLKKSKGVAAEPAAEIASREAPPARRDAPSFAGEPDSGGKGEVASGALQTAPAPVRAEAAARSAGDAMAPAPPAGRVTALKAARAPLAWDVTVAEAFVRGWALRRIVALPPSAEAPAVTYRVTLDAEGKVVSARALGPATDEMETAVRSLVFQRLAADAPVEIEIALAAR